MTSAYSDPLSQVDPHFGLPDPDHRLSLQSSECLTSGVSFNCIQKIFDFTMEFTLDKSTGHGGLIVGIHYKLPNSGQHNCRTD